MLFLSVFTYNVDIFVPAIVYFIQKVAECEPFYKQKTLKIYHGH